MGDLDSLRATLRLTLAPGVGAITFQRLIKAFGDAASVPVNNPPLLRRVYDIGEKTAAAIAAVPPEEVDQELTLADQLGARILCVGDADYPASLKNIPDPPPTLYMLGRLAPTDALAIGLVGARHCTHLRP